VRMIFSTSAASRKSPAISSLACELMRHLCSCSRMTCCMRWSASIHHPQGSISANVPGVCEALRNVMKQSFSETK
jgi:hypothetical protein